ncbi:MAG: lysozyme [Pusillimonas sp.]
MKFIQWILSLFEWPDVEENLPTSGVKRPTMSANGLKLLKHYEGLSLTAYRDVAGVLTIGYGDTENVTSGMRITEAEAEQRLQTRLTRDFVPGVITALTQAPTQHQLDAMTSLAYNIGVAAFQRSTLLKRFNEGDISAAADQFLVWHYAAKKSIKGLRKRRAAERMLFLGGDAASAINIGDNTA